MTAGLPMRAVGVVGVGRMGAAMAARLCDAGWHVRVHDRDPAAASAVSDAHGAVAVDDVGEVVVPGGAVVTMLPDGGVVRQVVEQLLGDGDGELARAADTVLIDMSSSDPTGTVELGGLLDRHGVAFLDAPVSGGVGRAVTGELSVLIGGDAQVLDRCRGLLEVLGGDLWHVGGRGAGHALKALNNLLSATGLIAAAEVLLVGRRFGLDSATMLDAINASTGRNNSTENKFAPFVLSRRFDAGFALDLMVKDLRTALKLADDTATPSPIGVLITDMWARAADELGAGADHTEVVRWLEQQVDTRL